MQRNFLLSVSYDQEKNERNFHKLYQQQTNFSQRGGVRISLNLRVVRLDRHYEMNEKNIFIKAAILLMRRIESDRDKNSKIYLIWILL